jgi:hypothetical protein
MTSLVLRRDLGRSLLPLLALSLALGAVRLEAGPSPAGPPGTPAPVSRPALSPPGESLGARLVALARREDVRTAALVVGASLGAVAAVAFLPGTLVAAPVVGLLGKAALGGIAGAALLNGARFGLGRLGGEEEPRAPAARVEEQGDAVPAGRVLPASRTLVAASRPSVPAPRRDPEPAAVAARGASRAGEDPGSGGGELASGGAPAAVEPEPQGARRCDDPLVAFDCLPES